MSSPNFPISSDPIGVRLVAAIGRRGELGFNNRLLFRLKTDMSHFRRLTARTPLVMGRKTWESFPNPPLPGRPNIVATRNTGFLAPGAFVYSGLPPALAAARAMAARAGLSEAAVIGGAEIYQASLDLATHMSLTEVDAERDADAFFPAFDRTRWREIDAVRVSADEDNEVAFVIRNLERIA